MVLNCTKLAFRDRNDLARAGLGDGIGSGFSASILRPELDISSIDFYGLDDNGLVVVEIKSNLDVITLINKTVDI